MRKRVTLASVTGTDCRSGRPLAVLLSLTVARLPPSPSRLEANVLECIWAHSFLEAKAKASLTWMPWWNEIKWIDPQ
jgi:hypothetical protein